ncbi:hypothetical protein [Actinomycetospora sp. CA-053990]|uniref:hypothetical protein n=1 Tax=Actinomycetospora sp. CA-053990 TaxID=3239891 RepID=UPI003D940FA8
MIATPLVIGRSHPDTFAVPDGFREATTRSRFSAARSRRAAHSGSSAPATSCNRAINAPTGNPGASGNNTRHT